jgi:hypothetical protein
MEQNEKDAPKTTWWGKKSKEEKKTFIIETVVWVLGVFALLFIALSKELFGQDLFGNEENGFVVIGPGSFRARTPSSRRRSRSS